MARTTEMTVNQVQVGLSPASRWLTRVTGAAYLLLGLVMFAFPVWSAHHFPWKVSSFVAITLGSYLLGNAWIAAVAQHTWTFARRSTPRCFTCGCSASSRPSSC